MVHTGRGTQWAKKRRILLLEKRVWIGVCVKLNIDYFILQQLLTLMVLK